MGLDKGYDDTIICPEGTIKTVGDITYGSSRTEIEVKTRASEEVRYLGGMKSTPISLTVISGTDPEDPNGVNGYDYFKTMFENQNTAELSIGDISEKFICTKFETTAPVDGLKTANVDLRISADDEGSSSSSSGS